MLGTPIVTEGVKFLFHQANALLQAWNKRSQDGTDVAEGESLDVALPHSPALAVPPAAGGAVAARVGQAVTQLRALATSLGPSPRSGSRCPTAA